MPPTRADQEGSASRAKPEPARHHPFATVRAEVIALITGLLLAAPAGLAAKLAKKKAAKPHIPKKTLQARGRDTPELPDDSALPGLKAIRTACLGALALAPGLGEDPLEFMLRGYTRGSRATIEVRAGDRRIAVKVYAEDAAREARLYQALAAAGLCGDSGARVPPLLAWEPHLRLLAIGWLEGPTARELVERGQGQRAGELGAQWIRRAASLNIKLGLPFGAERMLHRGENWAAKISAAGPELETAARRLISLLKRTRPKNEARHLVHGTFYARHVLDLGDGPGVIDWMRFAQGPLELDAGMFLATLWRIGLRGPALATEAAQAQVAFLAGAADLLDERALAWHRAAALLRLADKQVSHGWGDWLASACALLDEATRLAASTGSGA